MQDETRESLLLIETLKYNTLILICSRYFLNNVRDIHYVVIVVSYVSY